MSYRVFARKYRPQTFEEVVGQEHITRTLQNAIAANRLAQAYLFVGPRGIGKTSTARILAKALNCVKGPTIHPCGVCDACREIAEGNSLDVLEIDGASNNSVEHVRELRENAAYQPASALYKIYLVDEVHMLSTAAFNALLKTLEEPPPHVKFIFATTEAQKVPATITSRCQRFDLRRIPADLIAKHLQSISAQEQIELEDAAADAIAKGADGGLRDAESMLDQLVAFCGDKISATDVLTVFGFTSRQTVTDLCARVFARDASGALAIVEAQAEAGRDLVRLLSDVIAYLRDLLVRKVQPGSEADAADGTEAISNERLLMLLDHFADAESRLRWATDKRLYLDIAMIKAVHILNETNLTDVIEALASIGEGGEMAARPSVVREEKAAPRPSPQPAARPEARSEAQPEAAKLKERVSAPEVPNVSDGPAEAPLKPGKEEEPGKPAPAPAAAPSDPGSVWREVAAALGGESVIRFGWLERGEFAGWDGVEFRVRFPASLEENTKAFFWNDLRKKAEERLKERLGTRAGLNCEFSGDIADTAIIEIEDPAPEKEPVAAKAEDPAINPADAFKDDPLIRRAVEIFKAEIEIAAS